MHPISLPDLRPQGGREPEDTFSRLEGEGRIEWGQMSIDLA